MLGLSVTQHLVPLLFRFDDLLLHFHLLLGLDFQLFFGLVQDALVEVLALLQLLLTLLLPQFNLLLQHLANLLHFLLLQLLLPLLLLLMHALSEFLNFAPLVLTDVRGNVVDSASVMPQRLAHEIVKLLLNLRPVPFSFALGIADLTIVLIPWRNLLLVILGEAMVRIAHPHLRVPGRLLQLGVELDQTQA